MTPASLGRIVVERLIASSKISTRGSLARYIRLVSVRKLSFLLKLLTSRQLIINKHSYENGTVHVIPYKANPLLKIDVPSKT